MAFDYEKQPWEEEIIGVDFSRRIPAGITVEAVGANTRVEIEETVGLSRQNPDDYAGHLVIGTPVLTGIAGKEKILTAMISGGVSNFKYRVSFRVKLSDNQKKEDDVWVTVKED